MDDKLRILGIARKAGMLAIGAQAVSTAARSGKAKSILTAADASERSVRNAQGYSADCGALHIAVPYTKEELGAALGWGPVGMLAILDSGFAEGFNRRRTAQ